MLTYYLTESPTSEDNFILKNNDHHHLKNVMRKQVDDNILVIYASKKFACKIIQINSKQTKLKIINEIAQNNDLNIKLTIAIGLTRNEKMDLIIQKLTELGVYEIQPIFMIRSKIKKLATSDIIKKQARWTKIAKEAVEQSNRNTLPIINKIIQFDEFILNKQGYYCYELPTNQKVPKNLNLDKNNYFLIGPEGGIDISEVNKLNKHNWSAITLGKRTLRMETAAISLLSIIGYIYE